MERSRNVIIVLSKSYLASEAFLPEVDIVGKTSNENCLLS